MAALSDEVKRYAVQALACFDSPAQVIRDVKQEFRVDVTPQQLQAYNPETVAGKRMSKKLRGLFDLTREGFLKDVAKIPIAQQSYRLRTLNRMLQKVELQGNTLAAAQILEQAAKEIGGAFTNRREHSGPNGAPIPLSPMVFTDEQLAAIAARAAPANAAKP